MRVLWVATKSPWPSIDGGRVVMHATIDALANAGVALTVIAPTPGDADKRIRGVRLVLIESKAHAWPNAFARSLRSGRPVNIERHRHRALAAYVADVVRREPFDIVHAEQLQALTIAEPARRAGLACVLRAQNVESAVWETTIVRDPMSVRARVIRAEAAKLRHFEADSIGSIDATIALSTTDATRLSTLNPAARVVVVPPPIAPSWSDASRAMRDVGSMKGTPTFTWIGSSGWPPNDDALRWLLEEIWPAIIARLPNASLHVFGATASREDRGVVSHPAPRDSAIAFEANTILLLPLRTAAGVRMRLLEAWTRGVPVIASPPAADGLDTADGRDLLLASDARAFADAAVRLASNADLHAQLVREGYATIARRHDPASIARATIAVYADAIAHRRANA